MFRTVSTAAHSASAPAAVAAVAAVALAVEEELWASLPLGAAALAVLAAVAAAATVRGAKPGSVRMLRLARASLRGMRLLPLRRLFDVLVEHMNRYSPIYFSHRAKT